ncbi:MAG: phosphomannomutase/phosphoglucomutase [Bacteroidales bacterium]|jgi:phosphomannomutase|nr:phosphomannomutase/phosphoglucomutase [Bacteroidales bacterium]MDD2823579.1 phosphomannomutase/phosphoglucomutase [Bacteroidales bacterium]MDD3100672.1 phosphomannomutase/phosphoglucomutase [Bacteroidales bacterium]MDD3639583.1 phosphomannomutase/phosphoglucomutase [Bacteroidales bacterium]MDD3944287.1 phosphomannomutase/phosphoglucomutase [Bacteroidales bacterium]
MGAFHAYDIRGIYMKDLFPENVYKMGFFLPALLKTGRIAVGRDCRESSPEVFEYLVKGICDAGADVYDLGLTTTPMVYYATAKHHFDGSVQITASHNGPEYNGLKVSGPEAMPIGYENGLNLLEDWVLHKEPVVHEKRGKVIPLDLREAYFTYLRAFVPRMNGLKAGIDISNGMAGLFVKRLLGTDGVFYINEELDGRFPNHPPNPLVPENIRQLQFLVHEEKCDIGIIFDGDADRVMFTDEHGTFISPDLVIALLGHHFLNGTPARVLQDIRSSKAVGEYLAPMGAQMHTWRVGRAFAAPRLREIDGLYGGELAGHYYFRDFFYSDSGLLAALLVLDVLVKLNRPLSRIIADIRKYENSGEINFRIARKQEAMDALKEHFTSKESPSAFFDFDGYRIEFPEWWFNVRPSNTEPYLRFIAEASDAALLSEKLKEMRIVLDPFLRES